jgi:GT2 family glycosyltransferase
LYLNPDTRLRTNALLTMCNYLEKNHRYGAVGCKLLNTDGSIQYTCARAYPSPLKEFNELAMLNRLFPQTKLFSAVELHYWNHENSQDVDCLSGACIMMRKEIEEEINGFDEDYFMYAEDVDLCYRIIKNGWKIYYLSEEEIIHHGGASTNNNQIKYFGTIETRRANCTFLKKHFGKLKALEYRLTVLGGSIIRVCIFLPYVFYERIICENRNINIRYLLSKYIVLLRWSLKG